MMHTPFSGRYAARSSPPSDPSHTGDTRPVRLRSAADYDTPTPPPGPNAELWPLNASVRHRRLPHPHGMAVGHRHLASLLYVHDTLRRRGVAAAFRLLTVTEVARAVAACEYFDLDALADLITDIPRAASSTRSAHAFDTEYHQRYSTGDTLVNAIRRKITAYPADFPNEPT